MRGRWRWPVARLASRRSIPDGAPMAIEIVADLVGDTAPSELSGYVVVALTAGGGFKIASNAAGDAAEIQIVEYVLAALRASQEAGRG